MSSPVLAVIRVILEACNNLEWKLCSAALFSAASQDGGSIDVPWFISHRCHLPRSGLEGQRGTENWIWEAPDLERKEEKILQTRLDECREHYNFANPVIQGVGTMNCDVAVATCKNTSSQDIFMFPKGIS